MHVDTLRDLWRKFSAPLGLFVSWVSGAVCPSRPHTHTHTLYPNIIIFSSVSPVNRGSVPESSMVFDSYSPRLRLNTLSDNPE